MMINTEHCPGSSIEDQFRARICHAKEPRLIPVPDRLKNQLTIEQYNIFLKDRYNYYHTIGGILSVESWCEQMYVE